VRAVLLVGIAIFTSIKMTSPSESSIAENVEALAWGEGDRYADCFVFYGEVQPNDFYLFQVYACSTCKQVIVNSFSLKGFCIK